MRYRDLVPCYNAFIDTRTPGSEAKENFTIIGPGVSENPRQHVHIAEPHGFNIGGARQPPQCVNSQHSHNTAEVFVIHTGKWRFDFGEDGGDASVEAGPGDIVSFPTHAFRGFTNIGEDVGFLWSVLGGDDPGRVTWAPRVFELAQEYGLALLENGALVDKAAGEAMPPDAALMAPTSKAEVATLRRLTTAEAGQLVVRAHARTLPTEAAAGPVVEEPLIGPVSPAERLPAGPLGWPHGFHVRRLTFDPAGTTGAYRRVEEEVLFVHRGTVVAEVAGQIVTLTEGDTMTVPIGATRTLHSAGGATAFVVRGGDAPQAARRA